MALRFVLAVALTALIGCLAGPVQAETVVPRTIIALYEGGDISSTFVSTVAEMPLNHLGLSVEYHSIHESLPDIANRADVRGVITWFYTNSYDDPAAFLKWALEAMDAGKKFVVVGSPGISGEAARPYLTSALVARFLGKLGLKQSNRWSGQPFDVTYDYATPSMFLIRNTYQGINPPYELMQSTGDGTVHLSAHRDGAGKAEDAALIVTNASGGYMDADYAMRPKQRGGADIAQWLVNPFEFFRIAYATDDLPKPDVTTLAGRRIYYSNIDGDGWNNVSQLDEYRGKKILSSQVVLEKAIEPYPDLPVMVAPIVADVDAKWVGTDNSRRIARAIWALPQVEAGSHTYSHPFNWEFFHVGGADAEAQFLHLYKTPTWKADSAAVKTETIPGMPVEQSVPRAYAYEPFNLKKEIGGSLTGLASLLPPGKHIDILAWSGDCLPYEEAIRLTREAKVQNINGGDSRFDPEYPAYASVAPIGRRVGSQLQIYNSTSNENTYTDLWTDNFHAYRYLRKTIDNSESPMRLSAMSIYYHMYSGEKEASLSALLSNLDYARSSPITPVTVAHYTHIAEGFYETQLTALGTDAWRVDKRGALQTIRFDRSSMRAVDLERSTGVVGQRHYQGNLYVYLDEAVAQPVIALKADTHYFALPADSRPYLIESRWAVSSLARRGVNVEFTAQGFGAGDMAWHMPEKGTYHIVVNGRTSKANVADDLVMRVKLEEDAIKPLHITIEKL